MNAPRAAVLVCLITACGTPAPTAPPPVELALDRPQLVTAGQTYRIASTAIEITPHHFTPLDTQAGHVLTSQVAATDGAERENIALHAYVAAVQVPTIWHGLSFQLSEQGFVYGGSTATITVTRATAEAPPPTPATCVPPGLEASHVVAPFALPTGCRFTSGGDLAAPRVVHTMDELAAAYACDPTVSPSPITIDLATSELHVVERMLSPAYGGGEIRDDGATVTFVTRFRSPCPDDPRPVPSPDAFAFVLPRGETRTFREATCTLPPRCD
jgi:hypothetical protein